MFTSNLHVLNRHMILMPKLAVAQKNGNMNVNATALLKKNGMVGNDVNGKADTVEIADTYQKADTPTEKMDTVQDLASYVSRRNKEIRDSIPKPIPPEMAWAIINADYPHKEDIERDHALAAKARPMRDKMKIGKQLTPEEMDFLRENFPELYTLAVRIEREMEQLRSQLNNCDTKEEKERLILQKTSQLMGAAKKDTGFVECMIAAINEEVRKM